MKNEIKTFFIILRKKYEHVKVSYKILQSIETTYIFIRSIYITKKYRNIGIGKSVMLDIIEFCKLNGVLITLSISDIYGTPYNVLFKFYSNLGFIENKNKNIFDGDLIFYI